MRLLTNFCFYILFHIITSELCELRVPYTVNEKEFYEIRQVDCNSISTNEQDKQQQVYQYPDSEQNSAIDYKSLNNPNQLINPEDDVWTPVKYHPRIWYTNFINRGVGWGNPHNNRAIPVLHNP